MGTGIVPAPTRIYPLRHGGIMPNYRCTAACRHCLYACGPNWPDAYITPAQMRGVCETLAKGGCRSIHIGGGEPFLDFDGLCLLVHTATDYGIGVEYVETNASWINDPSQGSVANRLAALLRAGVDTLCISLDPFHAEFVPYAQPLGLAEICRREGYGYFLWQERFLPALRNTDPSTAHCRAALEKSIRHDYLWDTARAYGIRFGGRAVALEDEYVQKKPLDVIQREAAAKGPCKGLVSTNHFHVDLYNRFIPPGCTGIALPLDEAVAGLEPGRYPAFEALYDGGFAALLALAQGLGFAPDPQGYPSVCAACFHTRKWLSEQPGFPELDGEFYIQALSR